MGNESSTPKDDPPAASDSPSAASADTPTASPSGTSSSSSLPGSTSSTSSKENEGTKRKEMSSSTVLPEPKRVKTVIDDPGAVKFFKRLGLPTRFLTEGKCQARELQSTDVDYHRVLKYVENSQELAFGVKISGILRITPRAHDAPEDFKYSNDPEIKGKHRKMLFHGTRANCLQSILENGLRLPQNNSAGIFFADRVAKSCFCTDHGPSNNKIGKLGYLLLCDVLLGNMNTDGNTYFSARSAPPTTDLFGNSVPCQSVLNKGSRTPNPKGKVVVDGCEWPLGTTINNWGELWSFNEYIVYDGKQVQPKFLIKVEFTEAPYHPKPNE